MSSLQYLIQNTWCISTLTFCLVLLEKLSSKALVSSEVIQGQQVRILSWMEGCLPLPLYGEGIKPSTFHLSNMDHTIHTMYPPMTSMRFTFTQMKWVCYTETASKFISKHRSTRMLPKANKEMGTDAGLNLPLHGGLNLYCRLLTFQ